MEEKKKNKKSAPGTTQDERAPQDENPMTTPVKSGRNTQKTLNDSGEVQKHRKLH